MDLKANTPAKIKQAIQSIKTSGKKLDAKIHEVAVQCMIHAKKQGDVTLFASLVNAMPKSSRQKALVQWGMDHAPIKMIHDKATREYKGKMEKDWTQNIEDKFNLEKAAATPFWEHSNEQAPQAQPMTFEKIMKRYEALRNQVHKAIESGDIPEEQAALVQNFVGQLDSIKVQ